MRKKITTATCGAILIAAVAFGIQNNMEKSSALSGLAFQCIEALADGEGASPCVGPKIMGSCTAFNNINCKDNSGCQ